MEKKKESSALTCILLAACMVLGSALLAQQAEKNTLLRQLKMIGSIVAQRSVSMAEVVRSPQKARAVVKFAGAVTGAYIDFELIPVNEAKTFVVVFESLSDHIRVDKFSYRRKNLTIDGDADNLGEYGKFIASLREKEYFRSVTGHYYTTTDDTVRFAVECAPNAA